MTRISCMDLHDFYSLAILLRLYHFCLFLTKYPNNLCMKSPSSVFYSITFVKIVLRSEPYYTNK